VVVVLESASLFFPLGSTHHGVTSRPDFFVLITLLMTHHHSFGKIHHSDFIIRSSIIEGLQLIQIFLPSNDGRPFDQPAPSVLSVDDILC